MKENFDRAFGFLMKWEGGYVNDPNDPGGETNWGISKRIFPDMDIKNLTKDQALKIYKQFYWDRVDGDNLPWPLDLIVFDTAVNMGVGRALQFYTETKNPVEYIFFRIKRYSTICVGNPKLIKFLNGWLNRAYDLWKESNK